MAILATLISAGSMAEAVVVAAGGDPEILSTQSVQPRFISAGAPTTVASMPVPNGRWVAWVVLRYDAPGEDPDSALQEACWTTIVSGRQELDRHTVTARSYGREHSYNPVIQDSLAMSVAANVTSGRTRVKVQCRTQIGDGVILREVRVVAMRAGTLTRVTPLGSATWGSGDPRVIQWRHRDPAGIPLPAADVAQTLASMDLGPGAWWIRAHFSVLAYAPGDDWTWASCRLAFGGDRDEYYHALDQGDVNDRHHATMEVAASVSAKTAVKLRCHAAPCCHTADVDPRLRDVRITAVRAGALTLGDGSDGSTWTTSGSGRPKVIHADAPDSVSFPGGEPAFQRVARIPLKQGTWFMTAKYEAGPPWNVNPGPNVGCRLRQADASPVRTAVTRLFSDGTALQLVGTIEGSRGGTLWLECRWDQAVTGKSWVHQLRMTAVRVHGPAPALSQGHDDLGASGLPPHT